MIDFIQIRDKVKQRNWHDTHKWPLTAKIACKNLIDLAFHHESPKIIFCLCSLKTNSRLEKR
jgi:hypothetical protein